MKKIFLALLALGITTLYAAPQNLDMLKANIISYYENGQYDYAVQKVIEHAKTNLEKHVKENQSLASPKKLALVLDVDDTSLSTYLPSKAIGFGGTIVQFDAYEMKGNLLAIRSVLSLYQMAVKEGITVFFITGREEFERASTESNLKKVGFIKFAKVYMRPNGNKEKTERYKTSMRKLIVAQGYDIVENVGDQYSDLSGGYADAVYKIPNPMYFIP